MQSAALKQLEFTLEYASFMCTWVGSELTSLSRIKIWLRNKATTIIPGYDALHSLSDSEDALRSIGKSHYGNLSMLQRLG